MTTSNPKVIKINKRKAIQLLEEAVAERGADYVYGEHYDFCEYAIQDHDSHYENVGEPYPACIVGVALSKAGVSVAELAEVVGDIESIKDEIRGVTLSSNAVKVWREAQRVQDRSTATNVVKSDYSWGRALEAARKVAYGEPGPVNN